MQPGQAAGKGTWRSRVTWLLTLWAAGVTAMAALAWVLRQLMRAAGLGT